MTNTSITSLTAQKLSVKPAKARLYYYLTELSKTSIADGKLVTTDIDVEGLRQLGRDTIASLSAALSGMAQVPYAAEDGSNYELFGFISSYLGEIIETICSIDQVLGGLNENTNWPVQPGEDSAEITLSRLFWLIPYANNPPKTAPPFSLKELENLLACFVDTESVNLRVYTEMLEVAAGSGELDRNTANALRFSSEWAGFICALGSMLSDVRYSEECRNKAA